MVKYFMGVLAVLLSTAIFSQQMSEIRIKGEKSAFQAEVKSIDKNTITYILNGADVTRSMDEIDFVKNINKEDEKFKKTVILTNKDWFSGAILYQDREKITVDLGQALRTIKNNDVVDIVSAIDFEKEAQRSPWKALGFSALFPGFGQFYSNRYLSGGIFTGTFLATSSLAFVYFYQAKGEWGKYEDSSYVDKSKYNSYKQKMYVGYGFAGVAVGLYIWNLIDAYTGFSYKYDVLNVSMNRPTDTGVSFQMTQDKQFVACIIMTF